MFNVNIREADDAKVARWIYYNKTLVQVLCILAVSLPWVAVALWGMRWAWIAMANLLPALYFGFMSYIVEREDEDNADI